MNVLSVVVLLGTHNELLVPKGSESVGFYVDGAGFGQALFLLPLNRNEELEKVIISTPYAMRNGGYEIPGSQHHDMAKFLGSGHSNGATYLAFELGTYVDEDSEPQPETQPAESTPPKKKN